MRVVGEKKRGGSFHWFIRSVLRSACRMCWTERPFDPGAAANTRDEPDSCHNCIASSCDASDDTETKMKTSAAVEAPHNTHITVTVEGGVTTVCVCAPRVWLTCSGVWWCIWRPGSWQEETYSQSPEAPADARCSPRFLTHTEGDKKTRCLHTHTLLGTQMILSSKQKATLLPEWLPHSTCTHTHTHTLKRVDRGVTSLHHITETKQASLCSRRKQRFVLTLNKDTTGYYEGRHRKTRLLETSRAFTVHL